MQKPGGSRSARGWSSTTARRSTPHDVIASYDYEDNDANAHGDSRSTMASIAERKVDGDWVVLTLHVANADLPTQLSTYGLIIGPAGTEGPAWEEGIGTGPYKLANFNPEVRTDVTRNPNHYRDDEGWFDSSEILNIQDQASRSNVIRTGEVDIINRPDPKTTHLLGQVPGINVIEIPGNQHYTMPMRTDTDPYTNLHVRQALKHAVDREAILDKILRGYGYLGNDHPIGKGQAYFNKTLPQRVLDPDKAKWHLKQAGLASLDVELFAGRHRLGRSGRRGAAGPRGRQESRYQHQADAGGRRRLLGGYLAAKALVHELLGRAPRPRTGCSPPLTGESRTGTRPSCDTSVSMSS